VERSNCRKCTNTKKWNWNLSLRVKRNFATRFGWNRYATFLITVYMSGEGEAYLLRRQVVCRLVIAGTFIRSKTVTTKKCIPRPNFSFFFFPIKTFQSTAHESQLWKPYFASSFLSLTLIQYHRDRRCQNMRNAMLQAWNLRFKRAGLLFSFLRKYLLLSRSRTWVEACRNGWFI
jgi:hypothetical protein